MDELLQELAVAGAAGAPDVGQEALGGEGVAGVGEQDLEQAQLQTRMRVPRPAAPSGRLGPSSSTQRAIRPASSAPPIRTTEPGGAYLLALASRLTNTCVRRGASPRTSGSG